MLAHPSHGSWPHRELHRNHQRQGPHAGTATHFGSSTEGPSDRIRMRGPPPMFFTPHEDSGPTGWEPEKATLTPAERGGARSKGSPPGGVDPPVARDIPSIQLGEASWTSSLE
eukprot:2602784-Pyramimonas_sp.AAC.1